MNASKRVKDIAQIGIVAALYVALTLALYPLSYGSPQFRLSESLVLLTYFNNKHGIGATIGVFIANFFNPEFALIDCIFGTLSTLIAVILICFINNFFIASLMPTLTSIIVVLELYFVLELPFLFTLIEVMGSMFVIESIIGYTMFRLLIKNKNFLRIIKNERKEFMDNEI